MGMMIRVLDKIVFTALFLTALQVPILADHYRQYLSGFYDATEQQVAQYRALAEQFGYDSVDALVDALEQNPDPVVRQDAGNKAQTIASLGALREGLQILSDGHYYEQAWYMLHPRQNATLTRVLDNFAPSVPLNPNAVLFSLITAIALNMFIWAPFWCAGKVRHWHRHRHQHHHTHHAP